MYGTSRWLGLIALAWIAACSGAAPELSGAEERGRQIYFGEPGSPLDTATAQIGGMDVSLPARGFPCASCHGRAGSGFAERGAVPTDLSRGALTRPYSITGPQGRRRPPYDLEGFRNAVRAGTDPGGNALSEAMPRFDLSDQDLRDLWAFLEVIDTLNDPGVSEEAVRIAVLLSSGAAGEAQRRILDVLADDINTLGGVHGRELSFVYQLAGRAPDEDVLATLVAGRERQAPGGQPAIGMALDPAGEPQAFALIASDADQAAALRRFAAGNWGIVNLPDACERGGGPIRLLTSANCVGEGRRADQLLMTHTVFSAIPPAGRRSLPAETFVALPAPAQRAAPQAQAAFARTRVRAGTGRETIVLEAEAYSAAVVLIEAMMRAGRDLNREGLVSALEEFRDFEGALTPPLSFGRNRRHGSRGVEIFRYSPDTGVLSTEGIWIDPEQ